MSTEKRDQETPRERPQEALTSPQAGPQGLAAFVEAYRRAACPICGRSGSPLNAYNVTTVKSYLVVTTYSTVLVVGCPGCIKEAAQRCIKEAAQRAQRTTSLQGWWGIPWGIVRTIQALHVNSMALRTSNSIRPTKEFVELVSKHRRALI